MTTPKPPPEIRAFRHYWTCPACGWGTIESKKPKCCGNQACGGPVEWSGPRPVVLHPRAEAKAGP